MQTKLPLQILQFKILCVKRPQCGGTKFIELTKLINLNELNELTENTSIYIYPKDLPCVEKWFWPEMKTEDDEEEEEEVKDEEEEEEEEEMEVCCWGTEFFKYYSL